MTVHHVLSQLFSRLSIQYLVHYLAECFRNACIVNGAYYYQRDSIEENNCELGKCHSKTGKKMERARARGNHDGEKSV
jgi:hypothetical protein